MCGIVGAVGVGFNPAALESIHHRGPDGSGVEHLGTSEAPLWLAHVRLSILDLSPAGRQPMQSRDGRWWLTYNGEIYNHRQLRQQLPGEFRGHSDTETLVELLASQGIEKTLGQLNGMFAFAAWDRLERKLYLVRDPFGIKPLYYVQGGEGFAFASEVRALKALGVVDGVDPDGLRQFLALRYVPSPRTLWRDVSRLPPGDLVTFDLATSEVSRKRYILPARDRFEGTIEDAGQVYRNELAQAVERQLLSDVPVGVLLSGGIDSALVAAMAKDAGQRLPCYCVGFGPEHRECEIAEAAHTARVLDLPFHSITVSPHQLRDALPAAVQSIEEPLGTTSVMPMWYLVRRAREDVTVVLTGQGSDEPWGGYRRYQVAMVQRYLPWPSFWKVVKSVAGSGDRLPEVLERGLRTLSSRDLVRQISEACALFPARERQALLGDREDGGATRAIGLWLEWLQDVPMDPAERMMRVDARMNLADDLLLYGDKISMAASLEARVPMLDLGLVRFIESLPLQYRVRLRDTKIVHKRMAEKYLPREIVQRRKKGFQVPFGAWSRGSWKEWIADRLLDTGQPHLQVMRREGIEQLWRQHQQARPDRSRQIFALLMLSLWWERQG